MLLIKVDGSIVVMFQDVVILYCMFKDFISFVCINGQFVLVLEVSKCSGVNIIEIIENVWVIVQ